MSQRKELSMTVENSMKRELLQKKIFQKNMSILDKYGIYIYICIYMEKIYFHTHMEKFALKIG